MSLLVLEYNNILMYFSDYVDYKISYVGPKNLTTPAHFILSLRPTLRREKWPRTNKKSPNSLKTLPRTILFSASQIPGEKNSTLAKAASQSTFRKMTSTVGYPWEYGVGTIQGETVTCIECTQLTF